MRLVLLFIALIALCTAELEYDRVYVEDERALCLDGSQAAYYVHLEDPTKVVLFFEGGGWCGDKDLQSTVENCYLRSKTDLGSSSGYPAKQIWPFGILSNDNDNIFNNWTRIHLKYCDGAGHQGSRVDPILYKGAELYFRGQDITLGQLNSINRRLGLFQGKVEQIVVSGQSAGGLAAFQWINYIQGRISVETKIWAIPDSGVFVDFPNSVTHNNDYRTSLQNLLKLSNQHTGTPVPECNLQNKDELWRCMFAEHLIDYIQAPLFVPQSLYDLWSLIYIAGIRCVTNYKSLASCSETERKTIEEYHLKTMDVLFKVGNKNQNGLWAPVCVNHCYLTKFYYSNTEYRIPTRTGETLIKAVENWMAGVSENPRHIDFGEWPSNGPCSGV